MSSDGRVRSEIDTAATCIGAALAGEDTAEADVGLQLFAHACLDLCRIAERRME